MSEMQIGRIVLGNSEGKPSNRQTASLHFQREDKTEIAKLQDRIKALTEALQTYQKLEEMFGHGFDANHGTDCADCIRYRIGAKALGMFDNVQPPKP